MSRKKMDTARSQPPAAVDYRRPPISRRSALREISKFWNMTLVSEIKWRQKHGLPGVSLGHRVNKAEAELLLRHQHHALFIRHRVAQGQEARNIPAGEE